MRKYLREIRVRSGKTQRYVAECIGTTRQYYQMIENGERQQNISLDLLQKLSKALEIPLEELIQKENQYKQDLKNRAG